MTKLRVFAATIIGIVGAAYATTALADDTTAGLRFCF